MKKSATLIALPYKATELIDGQYRVGDDRVIFRVYEKDLSMKNWRDIYNSKEPVNVLLVGDNNVKAGDKFLAPKCVNKSFSGKVLTYLSDNLSFTSCMNVKLDDGKEVMTTKNLLTDSRKVLAMNEQIPFISGKVCPAQDIYYYGGDCRVEMDGDNAKLVDGKVVIEKPLELIPAYSSSKKFTAEELVEMGGREFKLEDKMEEIRIGDCYTYDIRRVKIRKADAGSAIFIDFNSRGNETMMSLRIPIGSDLEVMHTAVMGFDVRNNTIK